MADLRMERLLWRRGLTVAGVDEAGRGPLAGPVVAAACLLPPEAVLPGVTDSKKLTERRREEAYERIMDTAAGWGVGIVSAAEIDRVNIRVATFQAMRLALDQLTSRVGRRPDAALLDGNAALPGWDGPQRTVVGGDRKVLSIAAASIIAKVTRDRMAEEWEALYPGYGFIRHKGYSCREHFDALDRLGPCPLHRITFIDHRQLKFF
jgi:ribonuclease HII